MTLGPPILQVKAAQLTEAPRAFEPKLRWPSLDSGYAPVDLHRFPSRDEENWRFGLGEFGTSSQYFISALNSAQIRIWLVDCFLLKLIDANKANFMQTFYQAFLHTTADDVRLLTSKKDGYLDQIKGFRDLQNTRRGPLHNRAAFKIEVRVIPGVRGGARLPHDRFALIDDELWHWGANVGGTHHEVNAFSHGWSALETGAVDYFDRIWNMSERPS
ncbi:hypothetical protein [Salinarimonas ramus]|uniref:Uncharacterized protein n=1 Tax=Salinarimonas ramus TaxID=690164 RepID=A0A917Q568_9HYPH|nr:hypothetical protein [Salinarimonas ramus]GGK27713.1 hypothetical protein GCM10011322_12830 [Salinarimonas ramus]